MNETAMVQAKKLEVRFDTPTGEVRLNPNIVKRYLVHGKVEAVTDTEVIMFMMLCRYQQMNPYLREVYLVKFSERDPASVVVGKDTFTKRAAGVPLCQGYNAGIIVKSKDGKVEKRLGANLLDQESLIGGWAKVFRKGWTEPIEMEVSLKEYMRFKAGGEPTRSWREMPSTMIRKVALVQALREAFPDTFAHQYTAEEMPVDDSELPTAPVKVTPEEQAELDKIADEGFEKPAEPAQGQTVEPPRVVNGNGGKKPQETVQPADRNPFDERLRNAKEAEARAESRRPRTLAERMHEDGPVPQEQQEIF